MSMAAQTSYNFGFAKGVAGGLFDLTAHEIPTRQAEENLTFGIGTVEGTNAGVDVKRPMNSSVVKDFEGIVVHNSVMTELDMENNLVIKAKRTVGCLTKGKIWACIAPGSVPAYKKTAYLVKDGEYAGYFTSQSGAYSVYEKCESTAADAKKIVADTATPGENEIKISSMTSVVNGYVPAVGDYVKNTQIYGAGLDVGAVFGTAADPDNGIAVIVL